MKKILLIVLASMLLASCTQKTPETSTGATQTGAEVAKSTTDNSISLTADETLGEVSTEKGDAVKVLYILRDSDANGNVLDENVWSGKNPMEITIGNGGLLPEFEKALEGMRSGEVKNITLSPEQGYGTGTVVTEMPAAELAPEFTTELPVENIASVSKQTLPIKDMGAEALALLEGKNPGDIVMEEEGVKVVLVSKNDTDATLEFHNLASPFYPNVITAGLEASSTGSTFKIEKVDNDIATLYVKTSENPFTAETYKVGSTAKYAMPTMTGQAREIDVKIVEIGQNTVKVEVPNTHELANKTLHFQIKVVEVVKAPKQESTNTENQQ